MTQPTTTGRGWREKARKIEAYGFSTLLLPDHFGEQPDIGVGLIAAADATTSLRLGSFVYANDFRHPAILAHQVATADILSDGRFELGLGPGWKRSEYDQAGIPFLPGGTRVDRLAESLVVVRQLLSTGSSTFSGSHYTTCGINGLRDTQDPHAPVLLAAGGRRMLMLAAREAQIVGLSMRALPDGSLDTTDTTLRSLRRKLGIVRAAAGPRRFASLEFNILLEAVVVTDGDRGRRGWTQEICRRTGLERFDSPYVLIGTHTQMVERLVRLRAELGISYIVVFERDVPAFAPVVARLAAS